MVNVFAIYICVLRFCLVLLVCHIVKPWHNNNYKFRTANGGCKMKWKWIGQQCKRFRSSESKTVLHKYESLFETENHTQCVSMFSIVIAALFYPSKPSKFSSKPRLFFPVAFLFIHSWSDCQLINMKQFVHNQMNWIFVLILPTEFNYKIT